MAEPARSLAPSRSGRRRDGPSPTRRRTRSSTATRRLSTIVTSSVELRRYALGNAGDNTISGGSSIDNVLGSAGHDAERRQRERHAERRLQVRQHARNVVAQCRQPASARSATTSSPAPAALTISSSTMATAADTVTDFQNGSDKFDLAAVAGVNDRRRPHHHRQRRHCDGQLRRRQLHYHQPGGPGRARRRRFFVLTLAPKFEAIGRRWGQAYSLCTAASEGCPSLWIGGTSFEPRNAASTRMFLVACGVSATTGMKFFSADNWLPVASDRPPIPSPLLRRGVRGGAPPTSAV